MHVVWWGIQALEGSGVAQIGLFWEACTVCSCDEMMVCFLTVRLGRIFPFLFLTMILWRLTPFCEGYNHNVCMCVYMEHSGIQELSCALMREERIGEVWSDFVIQRAFLNVSLIERLESFVKSWHRNLLLRTTNCSRWIVSRKYGWKLG